jgi:hypothetical protein
MSLPDTKLIELSPIADYTLLKEMHDLRRTAWILSGFGEKWETLDYSRWPDTNFWRSRHWAVLAGERPVAGARFSLHHNIQDVTEPEEFASLELDLPTPIASFNHLFVVPEWQNRQLSSLLDTVRLLEACKSGAASIVVSTTTSSRSRSLISKGFELRGRTAQGYDALTMELVPGSADRFRLEADRLLELLRSELRSPAG